jgi:hypothetical protein
MSDVALNYFELFKNTQQSNELAWLDGALFMAHGIVVRVVDINTVVAVPSVNTGGLSQPVTATLLHASSALFESAVEPQVGDRILILSLDRKAPEMFDSEKPVVNKNAAGRGLFSCVGVLLSTFKGLSTTTVLHDREGENDLLKLESAAVVSMLLGRALTVVFDSVSGSEELVKLVFGKLSPLLEERRAAVTKRHGFDEDAEGKEITVPAPVVEQYSAEAPLTADYRAEVKRQHGFALDEDGNETAVPAPVTERYSAEAPITRSIQGPQTIVVGIDAEGSATEASVDVTIGENAGIALNSKAGLELHFDKAVLFETKDGQTLNIGGDLTIEVGGKVNITSAGCTINNVLEVK